MTTTPQISAQVSADGTGVLSIGGSEHRITESGVDRARSRIMEMVMARAADEGRALLVEAGDPDGRSWRILVRPDGGVEPAPEETGAGKAPGDDPAQESAPEDTAPPPPAPAPHAEPDPPSENPGADQDAHPHGRAERAEAVAAEAPPAPAPSPTPSPPDSAPERLAGSVDVAPASGQAPPSAPPAPPTPAPARPRADEQRQAPHPAGGERRPLPPRHLADRPDQGHRPPAGPPAAAAPPRAVPAAPQPPRPAQPPRPHPAPAPQGPPQPLWTPPGTPSLRGQAPPEPARPEPEAARHLWHEAIAEHNQAISRTIAVLSLKGGVGKTTTAIGLGTALAVRHTENVIAVDANHFGTLTARMPQQAEMGAAELAAAGGRVQGWAALRRFLASNPQRLHALAGGGGAAAYEAAAAMVENHTDTVVADCRTDLDDTVTKAVLERATQCLIVMEPSTDGLAAAQATLNHLAATHPALAHTCVFVICQRTRRAPELRQAEKAFAAQAHPVVAVPYDKHLDQGGVIVRDKLKRATRTAYDRLADIVTTR
ncbi:AAA family ATPase [Nocardiopsis baichengensis]|uniref:AAA family ATPase n=1 Tax=Nocardiopsis baichengensis TaxID=280240 RepID=UPI00034B8DAF|nr:AAA family ATPase [Nocardiopsis baichengensis]